MLMVETARTVFFAAKGPFVAFSHTVASRLISMPEIDADEAHALGERKSARLRHYMTGRLYNGTAGMHPRKFIVYDDVYFGYLALRAFRDDNLTLVQARLSEFDKGLATRLHTQRGHVRIFHKLKTALRFGLVNGSADLRLALQTKVRRRFRCSRANWRMDRWKVVGIDHDHAALRSGGHLPPPEAQPLVDGGLVLGSRAPGKLSTCCLGWTQCSGEGEPAYGGMWRGEVSVL